MDELQKALRDALNRAFDQRSSADADAQRSVRVLRIAIDGVEAPGWSGDAIALMRPAPDSSWDARWADQLLVDAADRAPAPPAVAARALPIAASKTTEFGYPQVHEYAMTLLSTLAESFPLARRIALALPGAAHGLDEATCIEHFLLGLVDALANQSTPQELRELVLLEPNDAHRALIIDKLNALLGGETPPAGWIARPQTWPLAYYPVVGTAPRVPAPFEQHLTYKDTLTAFVAMPFKAEMRDVFQYGIQGPATRSKFKAERLDFEHFTGSVIDQIKDRIQRAHLVIADMTGENPNVFLEIGYAWGKGRPTVLLWRKPVTGSPPSPPFDVGSDSRIEYASIGELDNALTARLQALYPLLRK